MLFAYYRIYLALFFKVNEEDEISIKELADEIILAMDFKGQVIVRI